ncbi:MAG: phosphopantetheine-binding protein [Candidatus Aminicenantes bacterium]|nr:phosphopantetheine-binding protein [Candidatus Aminicenantes bacterium]
MKEKIRNFIVENFLFGERELKDDESLFESGIIDSLGLIKLLAFIDEKFKVSIDMSEIMIENFNTLNDIMETLKSK